MHSSLFYINRNSYSTSNRNSAILLECLAGLAHNSYLCHPVNILLLQLYFSIAAENMHVNHPFANVFLIIILYSFMWLSKTLFKNKEKAGFEQFYQTWLMKWIYPTAAKAWKHVLISFPTLSSSCSIEVMKDYHHCSYPSTVQYVCSSCVSFSIIICLLRWFKIYFILSQEWMWAIVKKFFF